MSNVYLALYKGRKKNGGVKGSIYRFFDWLIRTSTKGQFSHSELVIDVGAGYYDCYSSSNRDGGVRIKRMKLPSSKWQLVKLDIKADTVEAYYQKTKSQKYDLFGAISSTIPFYQSKERQFCSEWCFNAITGKDSGWRFSPNDLYEIYK
jgi:hypothetical protein